MNKTFINRQIADSIARESKFAPVITVSGPRQSGKTTLVKHLFGGFDYHNFELPLTRSEFLSDPLKFLTKSETGIIIDEFQHIPDLLSYVQAVSDENEKPGRFILTGSQNFVMIDKISQSLAGRASLFTLLPFSLSELQSTRFSLSDLNSILFRGFYPRVVIAGNSPQSWYYNYINLYIERDVRQIINVRDLEPYSVFLRLCAARTGSILNFSEIARQVGKDIKTIKSWLRVLETSNIILMLRPYYRNYNKRIIKSPKIFFYDTGLLCALLNINTSEQIGTSVFKGNVFENFVISEIAKNINNTGTNTQMYFWNERNKKEIDLILDYGDRLSLVEIKSGTNIRPEIENYMDEFSTFSRIPVVSSFVVYNGDTKTVTGGAGWLNWKDLNNIQLGGK